MEGKVNKAIHTSSGRDTGVRQRKITTPHCELGDFCESACLLLSGLPAGFIFSGRPGLVWRPLIISHVSFLPRVLIEASLYM